MSTPRSSCHEMCAAGISAPPPPVLFLAPSNSAFRPWQQGSQWELTQQDITALTELRSKGNCPPGLGLGPGAQRKGHRLPLAGGLSQRAVKANKLTPTSTTAHTDVTKCFLEREKKRLLFVVWHSDLCSMETKNNTHRESAVCFPYCSLHSRQPVPWTPR